MATKKKGFAKFYEENTGLVLVGGAVLGIGVLYAIYKVAGLDRKLKAQSLGKQNIASANTNTANVQVNTTTPQTNTNTQNNTTTQQATGSLTRDEVMQIQTWLVKEKGLNLGTFGANKDGIDGDFGTRSQQAFRRATGLEPSPANVRRIIAENRSIIQRFFDLFKPATTQQAAGALTRDEVMKIQTWLVKEKGLNLGTFGANKDGIDGDFGTRSQQAFRRATGLEPSPANVRRIIAENRNVLSNFFSNLFR